MIDRIGGIDGQSHFEIFLGIVQVFAVKGHRAQARPCQIGDPPLAVGLRSFAEIFLS